MTPQQIFLAACRRAMEGGTPFQKTLNKLDHDDVQQITSALAQHYRLLIRDALDRTDLNAKPLTFAEELQRFQQMRTIPDDDHRPPRRLPAPPSRPRR